MSEEHKYITKEFVMFLVLSAVAIYSVVLMGAYQGYQIDFEHANVTIVELEGARSNATWYSIFVNNTSISLVTFIPIVGLLFMIFVQYTTGYYVGEIAKGTGVEFYTYTLILLTTVVGVVEYVAYTFAMAEGIMIVYAGITQDLKGRLLHHSWRSILIVVLLLLLGAIYEYMIISGGV